MNFLDCSAHKSDRNDDFETALVERRYFLAIPVSSPAIAASVFPLGSSVEL